MLEKMYGQIAGIAQPDLNALVKSRAIGESVKHVGNPSLKDGINYDDILDRTNIYIIKQKGKLK